MAGGGYFGFPTLPKKWAPRRHAKNVPPKNIFVESIFSLIFARNAQNVGFRGVLKKGCAKKSVPHRQLAKNMCLPHRRPKKWPPQNLRPLPINNEQSLIPTIIISLSIKNMPHPKI